MVLGRTKTAEDDAPAPRPAAGGAAVDSLIADGMTVAGDCRTTGALHVEGHVRGDVRAKRLRVTRTGRVDGDVVGENAGGDGDVVVIEGQVDGGVEAPRVEIGADGRVGRGLKVTEAVVRGRVSGPIVAERRLVLEETAVVVGDVTAPRLAVQEGGQVTGAIRTGQGGGVRERTS